MHSQVFLFSRARKSLGLATLSASQPGSWNQPPPPQQRPLPPQQPLLAQPPAPIPHSRKSENITCTDWLPGEGAGDAYAFKNTPVRDIWRQRVSGTTLYGERDLIWDFGSVSSTLTFRRKTAAARPDLSKSWIWQKYLVTQITLE